VVVCPGCQRSAAAVAFAAGGAVEVTPVGRRSGGNGAIPSRQVVSGDVAHQRVRVGCRHVDACGWLAELCGCQLRDRAKRSRRRDPWQWAPTVDEQRAGLRCAYGDDPMVDAWGIGNGWPDWKYAERWHPIQQSDGTWRWSVRAVRRHQR
jgi:hypothetical protein